MSTTTATEVGAYEAKTKFSELLQRAANGEEITITRHGTPVAKLVPVKPVSTPETRLKAIERMEELSKTLSLGGLKIKDLIAEAASTEGDSVNTYVVDTLRTKTQTKRGGTTRHRGTIDL